MNSGGCHSEPSSRLLSATHGTAAQLPSGQKGLSPGRPPPPAAAGGPAGGRPRPGPPSGAHRPRARGGLPSSRPGGGRGRNGPRGKAGLGRAPHLRQQRLPLSLPLLLARRQTPLALKPGRHRQTLPETDRRAATVQQPRRTARPGECRKRRP